jgi:hypothetical protein
MNEQPDVQAVRLQVREGRLQVSLLPDCGSASDGAFGSWGSLYVVSHAVNRGLIAERVCGRVEDVAVETYYRSAGGVTNRLRQAARNANKYLYLRNLVRGEEQALLAALACVAVRGTDAYACGIGPHSITVLNRGRVRTFQNHLAQHGSKSTDEWRSDGYLLGRKAKRSDPRFSYRQLLPGDLVLLAAGSDAESFGRAAEELAPTMDRHDIEVAARALGEFVGQRGDGSALLIGVQMKPTSPADVCKTAQTGAPRLPYSGSRFFRTLHRSSRGHRAAQGETLPKGEPADLPAPEAEVGYRMPTRSRKRRSLDSGLGQGARVVDGIAGSERVLQGGVERCRVVVTLLSSLLLALRAGVLWILMSCAGVVRRCWRWIRRRRVLENLAAGCRLALFGLWAGLKGLLVGILPERQGTTTTFAASARPMARARVLGFHPSGRSRAVIGGLMILLVVALVSASAVRVKSRLEQADAEVLASQVRESLELSEQEEGREAKMAMLAEAQELIDGAPASQRDAPELQQLSEELEARRDGLTGVVRLPFAKEEAPASGVQTVGSIVAHQDELYVLDALGQGVTVYALDQQGRISVDEEPLIWDSPTAGEVAAEVEILDIEWVEAGNGRLTPGLAALTSEGSLLEIRADGSTRWVAVAETPERQNARAVATYMGNLYVLDPGNENILKYIPHGDDYQHPPTNYVQEPLDINWESVTDLAIDGFVYLLLSDGSIVKLAGGQSQAFSQEGLYPALENPTAIFASAESQSIFVAEESGGRVVEFSKDGLFVRQYKARQDGLDPLLDLGAFTVDVARGRMLVGTASGVFFTDLPSLQEASGG